MIKRDAISLTPFWALGGSAATGPPVQTRLKVNRSTTRIKSMRESKSRPDAGLIEFEHIGYNQREQEIAYVVRTGLIKKRPA